ncbi:hypothetical protein [Marinobacter salarius]|jgi:hypothetical protein|uniref:hypothetical protein n=1 Tax=Marinobacter salarius TaxID=1420917 RepID=UPI001D127AA4|nr:hypothetical protein [Marinobacter salarius]
MEQFKSLEELDKMDEKHRLMGAVCGAVPDLEKMHDALSAEYLNDEVPDDLKGQFNVARNMALYTYFFYALAPEVHLKTYTIIEHALKLKANSTKRLMLGNLLHMAVENEWISDSGFRHIQEPSDSNDWCKKLPEIMRNLRNSQAHGSTLLVGDCLHHVRVCADFINQLYPDRPAT